MTGSGIPAQRLLQDEGAVPSEMLGKKSTEVRFLLSQLRVRAVVARQPHKLEVGGSNPSSATIAPELDITPVKTRMRTEVNVPCWFGHLRSVCRARSGLSRV